jgi:hypothetical protein
MDMKRSFLYGTLLLLISAAYTSCNTATPEKYFGVAVLNTNFIVGFSNNGLYRELQQPSAKLVEGTSNQTVSMKRKEVIDGKIVFLQENLEKLKSMRSTTDAKEMLEVSIALHEYVIPVYKNEYQELARLFDEGKPDAVTEAMARKIYEKYSAGYEAILDKLISVGKAYAARHEIKVNWGNS